MGTLRRAALLCVSLSVLWLMAAVGWRIARYLEPTCCPDLGQELVDLLQRDTATRARVIAVAQDAWTVWPAPSALTSVCRSTRDGLTASWPQARADELLREVPGSRRDLCCARPVAFRRARDEGAAVGLAVEWVLPADACGATRLVRRAMVHGDGRVEQTSATSTEAWWIESPP